MSLTLVAPTLRPDQHCLRRYGGFLRKRPNILAAARINYVARGCLSDFPAVGRRGSHIVCTTPILQAARRARARELHRARCATSVAAAHLHAEVTRKMTAACIPRLPVQSLAAARGLRYQPTQSYQIHARCWPASTFQAALSRSSIDRYPSPSNSDTSCTSTHLVPYAFCQALALPRSEAACLLRSQRSVAITRSTTLSRSWAPSFGNKARTCIRTVLIEMPACWAIILYVCPSQISRAISLCRGDSARHSANWPQRVALNRRASRFCRMGMAVGAGLRRQDVVSTAGTLTSPVYCASSHLAPSCLARTLQVRSA
jgi:hypothetical protein